MVKGWNNNVVRIESHPDYVPGIALGRAATSRATVEGYGEDEEPDRTLEANLLLLRRIFDEKIPDLALREIAHGCLEVVANYARRNGQLNGQTAQPLKGPDPGTVS